MFGNLVHCCPSLIHLYWLIWKSADHFNMHTQATGEMTALLWNITQEFSFPIMWDIDPIYIQCTYPYEKKLSCYHICTKQGPHLSEDA